MADKKKELKGNDLEKVSGGLPHKVLRGYKETKDISELKTEKKIEKNLNDNKILKGGKRPQGVV